MPKETKSVRWTEDRSLAVTLGHAKDPGPDEVQIKVASVGVCGSDLHFFRGDFPARPGIVPGHEFAGIVTAVGSGANHFSEGDLVAVEPLLRCGHCRFCLSGDYHVCSERGLIGENRDGGMSEYVTVPAITAFRTPEGVDAELGALAEPLACSIHAFVKAKVKGHETVFILGAGTIGLTALLAAKAYGCNTIILARHPHQQEAARRLGADEVISDNEAGESRLGELRRSQSIDVAVETVGGKGDTLTTCQLSLRPKGRLLLIGVFSIPTVPINPLHLALREVEIIGSMTYAATDGRADYEIALNVLSDCADVARSLVTHRFQLDDVQQAFETAMDKSTQSIKVHLNPEAP
jgi:L-iditol 2-dehydrogenase|tara:strand:+ start:3082 stop:4131 length:1050 start_codon:yes stop_codon:yes gene_type:complete